jgi:hypothetical protein
MAPGSKGKVAPGDPAGKLKIGLISGRRQNFPSLL